MTFYTFVTKLRCEQYNHPFQVFGEPDEDTRKNLVNLYCLIMLGIAVVSGISYFFMNYLFAYSGEKLTQRIRHLAFETLLKQVRTFALLLYILIKL